MTHTVDEVSDLLDVPRPTLYRYLREYSIPHLRRSGKIYVPEESFDRIKEVRELHKEGLGTESVRRRLRGESNVEVEGIEERLDRILEALEGLREDPKPAANEAPSVSQALQTVLARQSLLISEISNLTGMVEELAHTNSRPRKVAPGDPEEAREQETSFEQLPGTAEKDPAANGSLAETSPSWATPRAASTRRGRRKFGAMARRRRRGALAILLLALLTGIALAAYAMNGEEGSRAAQEGTSAPPQETTSGGSEGVSTRGPDTTTPLASTTARDEREPAGYAKDRYGDSAQQQPLYQGQYQTQYQAEYATPGPAPQGGYAPSQSYQPGPAVYTPVPAEQ